MDGTYNLTPEEKEEKKREEEKREEEKRKEQKEEEKRKQEEEEEKRNKQKEEQKDTQNEEMTEMQERMEREHQKILATKRKLKLPRLKMGTMEIHLGQCPLGKGDILISHLNIYSLMSTLFLFQLKKTEQKF